MKFDIAGDTGKEADAITEQVRPLLVGHGPIVQSLVLADLTAAWIAGHLLHHGGAVDGRETTRLRDDILAHFLDLIRQLTPLHHARIMEANKDGLHDPAD